MSTGTQAWKTGDLQKDLLNRMIDLLVKEDSSDMFFSKTPVNLLCKVIPLREYFLRIVQQLDQVMMYTDYHMKQMTFVNS